MRSFDRTKPDPMVRSGTVSSMNRMRREVSVRANRDTTWIVHDVVSSLRDTQAQIRILIVSGGEAVIESFEIAQQFAAHHQERGRAIIHRPDEIDLGGKRRHVAQIAGRAAVVPDGAPGLLQQAVAAHDLAAHRTGPLL